MIVASASIDGARQAAVTMDWLRQNGYQDLLGRSCVVINHVVPGKPNIDVDGSGAAVRAPRPAGPRHRAAVGQAHRGGHRDPARPAEQARSDGGSSNWPRRCPTTSTGSNVVDHHRRRTAASSSVTPGRPSTTRVTILTGRRMTDLVLPASAPIETYIDETVSVLAELLEDTPEGCAGGLRLHGAGGVGVRASGRTAAEGSTSRSTTPGWSTVRC